MKTRLLLRGLILWGLHTSVTLHAAEILAITEVMAAPSVLRGSTAGVTGPDYWELTNYGTEAVHLEGYRFNDNTGGLANADSAPFRNLVIQPGRSLVFVQGPDLISGDPVYSAESFRELWGLPRSVPVIVYQKNGFARTGDEVWLWRPSADQAGKFEVVDFVKLPDAMEGRAFTFDPVSGRFGALSEVGVDGGFAAIGSEDIGSPGVPPAPIPMAFLSQPGSLVVNPGDNVVLRVDYVGLPRPTCRWYWNENPFPVGVGSELVLPAVQAAQAGRYRAVLDNGLKVLASAPMFVTLQQSSTPPSWIESFTDQELYPGQSATLRALATGLPQPSYQWWHGETPIEGATSPELNLITVGDADAGRYSLVASNASGIITNHAHVRLVPRPKLAITEVMSAGSPNIGPLPHQDWWELTNFDTFPVDLKGYRFDDQSVTSAPSLATAWVQTNSVVLQPGESVIFVEQLTPEEFRQWWGNENLPPGLKIITYRWAALSLSATDGDTIWLWNPGATKDKDYVVAESFVASPPGRTFTWKPALKRFWGLSDSQSEDGVDGAFRAVDGDDIGSPGFVEAPPLAITRVLMEKAGVRIHWKSDLGRSYRVWWSPSLDSEEWTAVSQDVVATGGRMDLWVPMEEGRPAGFFRVTQKEVDP